MHELFSEPSNAVQMLALSQGLPEDLSSEILFSLTSVK